MTSDSKVTKLNKVAERILDPANGKPRQRQFRAMASEYIRGLLIEIYEAASSCGENARSSQRQTLSETVSDDGTDEEYHSRCKEQL